MFYISRVILSLINVKLAAFWYDIKEIAVLFKIFVCKFADENTSSKYIYLRYVNLNEIELRVWRQVSVAWIVLNNKLAQNSVHSMYFKTFGPAKIHANKFPGSC